MERILFVCTGNIDRSPTGEDLLRGREGFEVRSAGTMAGARRRVTEEDIDWADRIFVMEEHHKSHILGIRPAAKCKTVVLGIPDLYYRGDAKLISLMRERLMEHGIRT